jgi:hypothetical protein
MNFKAGSYVTGVSNIFGKGDKQGFDRFKQVMTGLGQVLIGFAATLESHLETNFALMHYHKWSYSDLENMVPWEKASQQSQGRSSL